MASNSSPRRYTPSQHASSPEGELARRQEALLAFVEAISSELELRPLLEQMVLHACRLIGADDGTIGLVDPAGPVVRMEAACCMGPDEVGSEYPPGSGLAGRVLELNQPVVLERYSDLPEPAVARENAVIGVPIRWRGNMIGFFGIGRLEGPKGQAPQPFTERDVADLEVFARHAAIAIENARRYLREQERGERLELIARVGTLITGDLRPEEMLQSAAEAIQDLLGYANVGIGVVRAGDRPAVAIEAMAGEHADSIARPFVLEFGEGIMGTCAAERRTIQVDDVHADPRYVPAPGVPGIHALISLPILVGDEVLGVLNVESDFPFEEEDRASLQIVADQLAVAMQNTRLYDQASEGAAIAERQRIARDLHDSVTQHLFGTVMVAESLAGVWERDPEDGKARTARVLELARTALGEMRALLEELRPARPARTNARSEPTYGIQRVRDFGLAGALGRLADEFGAGGLPVSLQVDDYARCEFAVEKAIYRITQEALHNTSKHAQASRASVRLFTVATGIQLIVSDDGRGMLPVDDSTQDGRGLGLTSMRERAASIGGTFTVTSKDGEGVTVSLHIPREAPRQEGGAEASE